MRLDVGPDFLRFRSSAQISWMCAGPPLAAPWLGNGGGRIRALATPMAPRSRRRPRVSPEVPTTAISGCGGNRQAFFGSAGMFEVLSVAADF